MTSTPGNGHRDRSLAAGYGIALAGCVIVAAAQPFLEPLLGPGFPLIVLPAVVVLSAWFGGFSPGLVATIGGSLTAAYVLPRPRLGLQIEEPADAIAVLLFTVTGLLVSFAIRQTRRQSGLEREAKVRVERELARRDGLGQLTATLSRAETPDIVIRTSLPDLLYAANAVAGAIFLTSDDKTACELALALGYDDDRVAASGRFPLTSKTLVSEAIRRRDLMVAKSDSAQAAGFSGSLEPFLGAHAAAVAVPLVSAGRAIGAVILSLAEPRRLDGEEREFLLTAGRFTAHALDRARLYEASDRARAEAEALRVLANSELRERQKAEEALRLNEGRYRALAARTSRLYALSAGLSQAASIKAVAKVVVREGKLVAGAASGSVVLLVDRDTHFETLYEEGAPRNEIESHQRFPADAGLCSTAAVQEQRPILVGSFAAWQEKYPASASTAASGGFTSVAALPLQTDGAAFGVLSFHFTVPVNFDEEYTALLTSVAQHAAQALDRARLYEAAEGARADAEAANRSKDDFLSTISHELRTPLNAVLGWAAMLRSGSMDEARTARAIEAIFTNATRQGRLIEELLDVSRIVAGRASLDPQDTDLTENIRGAVEAMMPMAAAKGVEIRYESVPGVFVVADPRRLEQVFLNLLSNAVKFTPADGRITIDVAPSPTAVQIRVTDTGAGIEPAFLPHVFERFRQADGTTKRGAGGLGLGLFIARQLIEAQGGTIRVASNGADQGTTFSLTLPAAPGVARPSPPSSVDAPEPGFEYAPVLEGVRVLLVDDEPDAREMMAAALETCGATVITAASAREALDTLARQDVDLLLSDIAMAGQDGYELIREIRAMSTHLASLPAAAVTAHARDDERALALAAGFQMHLTKPIHPTALARAVASLVQCTERARD